MNENTLHLKIREQGNENSWRKKALNVIRAEALKRDINWHDLNVVVELPHPDLYMTKDPGHTVLITRRL